MKPTSRPSARITKKLVVLPSSSSLAYSATVSSTSSRHHSRTCGVSSQARNIGRSSFVIGRKPISILLVLDERRRGREVEDFLRRQHARPLPLSVVLVEQLEAGELHGVR